MEISYFEDLTLGEVREFGSHTVTKQEIIDFAKQYDPQPFHIDEEAAKNSMYGGLIASGWHTAGLMMRMLVDNILLEQNVAGLGSPGFDDLKWLKPVRPGDTLSVRSECIEKRESRSRPDIGSAKFQTEVLNQDGDVVLSYTAIGLYKRRPQDTA
jgi:acyl dehydratase